ncbi:unnamed protein product, partial [Nesidiocoris tenuis]
MSDARPPRVFNFDADNLKKEWEDWHQNFEIYLTASKKHAESNPVKIAMLLNQLGSKGVELYNALKADAEITSTVETKEAALSKYTDVVSAFATHFAPRKNVLHERCKFNKLNLNSGQSLIEYVTALKNAAASCEFLERNNMIRDRLISQVPDEALLNRLLDEGDTLTLERTIDLCKLHDARKMEIQDFTNGENKIDAVRNFNRGSNRFRKPNKNLKVESKKMWAMLRSAQAVEAKPTSVKNAATLTQLANALPTAKPAHSAENYTTSKSDAKLRSQRSSQGGHTRLPNLRKKATTLCTWTQSTQQGGQMRVGQRARRRCDERAKGGEFGGEGGVKLERADLPSTSLACPWHVADPPGGPIDPSVAKATASHPPRRSESLATAGFCPSGPSWILT